MSRNLDLIPLDQWEHRELVSAATWIVIGGITRGSPLQVGVGEAIQLVLQWKTEKDGLIATRGTAA